MEGNSAVMQLRTMQRFFHNSISVLEEADSGFRPHEKAWTVAQQMRHTGFTIDWFVEGAVGKGFAENWEEQMAYFSQAVSFDAEKQSFDNSVDQACKVFGSLTEEQLDALMKENPIFGRLPIRVAVGGIVDHTAHHRGALATYARIIGKEPRMPY